jgi:NADH dehydrogenase
MSNNSKIITIFGGSGFLGREILRKLLKKSYIIQVVSRNPKLGEEFSNFISNGSLRIIKANIENLIAIEQNLVDSFAFINLVGLLFEKKPGDFNRIHVDALKNISLTANKLKISRLIHLSSLGVENSITSLYARTKLLGEQELRKIFPSATIIRPSIIFGAEDNFYNQFALMAKFSPFLPLIGGGKTKFQPVYVSDVASSIIKILEDVSLGGKVFELAGDKIYDFKEILSYILKVIGKKRILLPIRFSLAKIIGFVAGVLPKPPITPDQVELLKYDNILSGNYPGLKELGILPLTVEEIVPKYLN